MNLPLVLAYLCPQPQYVLVGDSYDGLTWLDERPQPSEAECVAAEAAALEAAGWDEVRAERDRLLDGSDWTQMPDSPLDASGRQAWAVYRQELRDIPQDFATSDAVVWPEQP